MGSFPFIEPDKTGPGVQMRIQVIVPTCRQLKILEWLQLQPLRMRQIRTHDLSSAALSTLFMAQTQSESC